MFGKFTGDFCFVREKRLLRNTLRHRASESHHWAHTWAPTPIPTNPQHLNDVVASRYHRTKTLFFPGRSVSSLHLPPAAQVGNQHQGHSPTRASQKTPALSVGLYLSRVMIPEYLPCSLASPDSCDWREGNSVRSQHLELRALSFLSCGLSPQITKSLYSSHSTVKQGVSRWKRCFT